MIKKVVLFNNTLYYDIHSLEEYLRSIYEKVEHRPTLREFTCTDELFGGAPEILKYTVLALPKEYQNLEEHKCETCAGCMYLSEFFNKWSCQLDSTRAVSKTSKACNRKITQYVKMSTEMGER